MCQTKFTYEQYCTFLGKNIIVEEIFCDNGKRKIVCTNTKCYKKENGCKNKLRLLTEE